MDSNNKNRSVLSTSFWALLQMVFLQVGALATTMYITRMLSTAEYGLIPLVNSLVVLLVVFVSLGLPSSIARFLATQDSGKHQKDVLKIALVGSLPWMIIAIICVFMVFPIIVDFLGVPSLLELQWVFIFILILELFRIFLEKICHGTGNMRVSATFSGWASLSIIIVTVPALLNSSTALMALSAKIIALLIPSIRAMLSLNKALSGANSTPLLDQPTSGQMIRYGFPLAVISLSGFGFVQLDILFLAFYMDTSTVGLYSVGVLLLIKLTALSKAIGFGVSPLYAKNNNEDNKTGYYIFGLKYSLIFAIPISIFLAIEGGSILAILFGSEYAHASESVMVLCLYFVMCSMLAVTSPVLDFGGKAKIRAYGAFIGATLNLVLNILLIPEYGAVGAAIATVCGYSILFIVTFKTALSVVTVNVFKESSIVRLIMYISPALLLLMFMMKYFNQSVSLIVNFMILLFLYPLALYALGVVQGSEIMAVRRSIFRKY